MQNGLSAYCEEIIIEYAYGFMLSSNLALPSALISLDRLWVPETQSEERRREGKEGIQ
jgi:hypothetical protein